MAEENNSAPTTRRFAVFLAIFFVLISLGLAGYILYSKITAQSNDEQNVLDKYGIFFRTSQEQEIYEQQYYEKISPARLQPAKPLINSTQWFCRFGCNVLFDKAALRYSSPDQQLISMNGDLMKEPINGINHACCVSQRRFISPDLAVDAQSKVNVQLVQLQGRRQYFYTDDCWHVRDCTGCGCAQENRTATAVVYAGKGSITLVFIEFPGCCKCYNNLRNPYEAYYNDGLHR